MDPDFIKGAGNVAPFAAFCIEYREAMALEDPKEYVSSLPIMIDCTCNGLQHLAGMMLDSQLAACVNLAPNVVMEDFYGQAARDINKDLDRLLKGDASVDWEITRDMVKAENCYDGTV